ncbi:hypothetical protein [Mycobacterium uberis]|uniref:hypothetical protein n=1 Tax=Mycobacterium uberis TaxID=2162698 RepID=UPI00140360D0|nr:hypothetical protein [Mycobacterium uberis]
MASPASSSARVTKLDGRPIGPHAATGAPWRGAALASSGVTGISSDPDVGTKSCGTLLTVRGKPFGNVELAESDEF